MENLFVLTVLVALAAVGLLGIFLAASEKELKVKRREIEELLGRLETISPQGGARPAAPSADHSAEVAELRARNQQLQEEMSALSEKLELSRRSIDELEASQRNTEAVHAEMEQLRAANDRLKTEIGELENRLQTVESGTSASAAHEQEADERYAHLQNEIVALKQELQDSHAKLSAAESYRQKAERVDALEAERESLQAHIAELEKQARDAHARLGEMAELRQRMLNAEQAQALLRAENERHQQEIARWRERMAAGEEYQRRLASLQRPYEELLARHATLVEQQREFENHLAAFARLMPAALPSDLSPQAKTDRDSSAVAPLRVVELTGSRSHSVSDAAEPLAVAATGSEEKPRRRFGLFSALVLLGALGLSGVSFLTSGSDRASVRAVSARPVAVADRPAVAVAPSTPGESEIALASAASGGEAAQAETRAPKSRAAASDMNQIAVQESRVGGTYQLTQAGPVHAAPSESSHLIGEVEAGTMVNVVGERGGWLEIRSKHGRPTGFIRRDIASRVFEQN